MTSDGRSETQRHICALISQLRDPPNSFFVLAFLLLLAFLTQHSALFLSTLIDYFFSVSLSASSSFIQALNWTSVFLFFLFTLNHPQAKLSSVAVRPSVS